MNVALICSLVRPEEKLLLEAFAKRGVTVDMHDDRSLVFDLNDLSSWRKYDVVWSAACRRAGRCTSSA